MNIYQLSDDAEHDLSEIYRRGFWKYGEHQADKFFNQLFERIELLVSFPESGRACEFIHLGLRRIEVNPYTVFLHGTPLRYLRC